MGRSEETAVQEANVYKATALRYPGKTELELDIQTSSHRARSREPRGTRDSTINYS